MDGHRLVQKFCFDPQDGITALKICPDGIVPEKMLRPLHKVDIPENAAGAEFVLILQIAAVAPFQDQHGQGVLSLPQLTCHFKLTQCMGDLAVADIITVQPQVKTGIYALKFQKSPGSLRSGVVFKMINVRSAGIIPGNIGWIYREGVADIGILRCVIAQCLPDARDRDGIPVAGVVVRPEEFLLQVINTVVISKFPGAVQKLQAVGLFPVLFRVIHPRGCRYVIGAIRHYIFVQHLQIFMVIRYLHGFPS